MTVKELITFLENCDPAATVICQYYEELLPSSDEPEQAWFTPTWVLEHEATMYGGAEVWIRE